MPKNSWIKDRLKRNEKWCFVGDSGVVGMAQEKVSLALKKSNCSRIFHLGDIVYPTGISSAKDPNLDSHFLRYHAPFKTSFYFVLGDHEYFAIKVDDWIEVAKSHDNLNFPYFFYGIKIDDLCVVAGDTTPLYRGKSNDPRTSSQKMWHKDEVSKKLKNCNFKIFMSHHSYVTMNKERKPPKKKYKKPLRDFFEKFVLGKYDLMISGHDHALGYVGSFKGTHQYISGAGGKYTKANDDRMDFNKYKGHKGPGFITLDIQSTGKIILKIIALEGPKFEWETVVHQKVLSYK